MRVLYIAEGYVGSKVHHELCKSLQNNGVEVTLFCVERINSDGKDLRSLYQDVNYEMLNYDLPTEKYARYKYDFRFKIRTKYDWLKKHVDLSKFDLVHASTIFSEGAVAYRVFKDYEIPYILNVRGTDVNFYLHHMFHLWPLALQIIKNACQIVCIADSLKNNFLGKFLMRNFIINVSQKTTVIPNGIEQFWLKNCDFSLRASAKKFLYIGGFEQNKNVLSLMKAFLTTSKNHEGIKLTLVGGGGAQHQKILQMCQENPALFEYLGKIYDKRKLLETMRQMDAFAMVSHSETFGLVYVEAMSQGLPVLYSKGQGIDGLFVENVGEKVNSHSIADIAIGLEKLIENHSGYDFIDKSIQRFDWNHIGKTYIEKVYAPLLNQ